MEGRKLALWAGDPPDPEGLGCLWWSGLGFWTQAEVGEGEGGKGRANRTPLVREGGRNARPERGGQGAAW